MAIPGVPRMEDKMNEIYAEWLVHSRPSMGEKMLGVLLAVLDVLLVAVTLLTFNGIFLLLAIIVIGLSIWRFPLMKTDYEYIFVDGQMDFDCIKGDSKRMNVIRMDFDTVDVVAPKGSHALDSHKNCRVYDFTGKDSSVKTYAIAGKAGDEKVLAYFDPNEKMLETMKMKSRSKIVEY